MRRTATALAIGLAVIGARRANADRYEASLQIQPYGGLARVAEDGTAQRATVPRGGLAGRMTYGLRDWLAVELELGADSMAAAHFEGVPVGVGGGAAAPKDVERTTRTARLTGAATLRLGVAWIPTLTAGLGGQARWRGDSVLTAPGEFVLDGHDGGLSTDLVVFARAGLDRRLSARWVVGLSVGASRALMSPAIDAVDLGLSVGSYWYPLW